MNGALNRWVRGYLFHCPVTEGKKALVALTRRRIMPEEPHQITATKHGFALQLNLANPEHERIYLYGEHDERYETRLVRDLVEPGSACWDIGANIGFYTCLLARLVGPGGRVTAFEPAAATRAGLESNVALNRFENVRVLPCALGAAEGMARIHYARAALFEGTATLGEGGGKAGSEEVAVTTIDRLVARLGPPQFLKIDVEGLQLEVWRGGREFFSSHAPLVLAEVRDSEDPQVLRDLEETIRSHGFRMFAVRKGGRVRELARITPKGPRNAILAKEGSPAAERLLARRVS